MALTPSTMLALGTAAPDFSLPDTDGNVISLNQEVQNKPFLVMFICNHCPYVKHIRKELANLTQAFQQKGLVVFGINSNDFVAYPEDSPKKMALEKKEMHYPFPYLVDESQNIAKAYDAACTPDFFLFDREKRLVYRGQLDDSRPGNGIPVSGKDLKAAVEKVLKGEKPDSSQKPSIGCNIKWKK